MEDAIAKKIKSRNDLVQALKNLSNQKEAEVEKEYMIALGQSIQSEIEEHQREVNFSIRESWIVMGILNQGPRT